jgi:SWI/SNF-related matrix-associated actin-dependent regulator of chromatin subfamily A3
MYCSHLDGTLRIIRYHGPKRHQQDVDYENTNIVITTYNTLAAEFEAKNSTLHGYEWYRVVLDEGTAPDLVRRPKLTGH